MIECQEECDCCVLLDATDRWRVQLHMSDRTLARLRPEWDQLLPVSNSDQFFAHGAWQQLWWRHFGHEYALRLLTVREASGKLVGIAPLMAPRFSPETTLSFIGGTEIADYLDLIVKRDMAEEVTSLLLSAAREHLRWHTLDLHCLPERSRTPAALTELFPRHGVGVEIELEDVSPSVALGGSWDAYLSSLTKKERHELRRKLRRAVDDQGASWRTVENTTDLEENLDAFIGLHRMSSPDKAVFMTDQMEAYFRDLAHMALAQGWLRMGVLWDGSTPLSAALGFAYGNRLYLYNSGYDPAYAAKSVGIAAIGLLLRDSASEGLDIFDFLQGNEPYKYTLGAHDHPVRRVISRRGYGE